MSIMPLPVFEADADPSHRDALTDREQYERLEPPRTIVVRFGRMKLIGEYPYEGDAKPDTLVYFYVDYVDEIADEFGEDVKDQPWGTREVWLSDPDGNRWRVGTPNG